MIPTLVFPSVERLYPNLSILGVKEAWKIGFGWSLNVHSNLPVISQIRMLKQQGFTKVALVLYNKRTMAEFTTDWNISELTYYKTIKRRPPMACAVVSNPGQPITLSPSLLFSITYFK